MFTFTKTPKLVAAATLTLTITILFISWQILSVNMAEAAEISEHKYEFSLTKKFSDVYPIGYTAAQFKFNIEGISATGTVVNETVELTHSTDDTADTIVELPIGTYTLTEIGPVSFVPGEWTVQWSGFGCQNANSPTLFTTMTVSDDVTGNICRADNQWRHGKVTVEKIIIGTSTSPEHFDFTVTQGSNVRYDGPFDSDGINTDIVIAIGDYTIIEDDYADYTSSSSAGCSGTMAQGGSVTCTITNTYIEDEEIPDEDGTTGVLVVQKVIAGTTTIPFSDFSFSYTGASGSTTFDVSGTNNLTLATGTYSVTESPATGYTTDYSNCTDVTIAVNSTSTCIITNTLETDDGGGGGSNDADDYRLQGYVWHDTNEDGVRDENEDPLADWTVHATGNSSSQSTITDSNGFYFFIVDEGVWTLSETVMTDWAQTHPTPVSYEVTVPEVQPLTLLFPFNYLLSIAHAETININGDFNFGNVFQGGGGSGSGGGGGSTGTRIDRSSGGVSNSSGNSSSNTPAPTPLVLGEQVSIVPSGGANAGAGSTSPERAPLALLIITAMILAITLVKNRKSA